VEGQGFSPAKKNSGAKRFHCAAPLAACTRLPVRESTHCKPASQSAEEDSLASNL